jgi:ketosteroid isomerase-like protein
MNDEAEQGGGPETIWQLICRRFMTSFRKQRAKRAKKVAGMKMTTSGLNGEPWDQINMRGGTAAFMASFGQYRRDPVQPAEVVSANTVHGAAIIPGLDGVPWDQINMRGDRAAFQASLDAYRRDSGKVSTTPAMQYLKVDKSPSARDVENWFSYHAPVGDQARRYEDLRAGGGELATRIIALTPPGPDQDEAIRLVRSAVHWANAAIACSPPAVLPEIQGFTAAVGVMPVDITTKGLLDA